MGIAFGRYGGGSFLGWLYPVNQARGANTIHQLKSSLSTEGQNVHLHINRLPANPQAFVPAALPVHLPVARPSALPSTVPSTPPSAVPGTSPSSSPLADSRHIVCSSFALLVSSTSKIVVQQSGILHQVSCPVHLSVNPT